VKDVWWWECDYVLPNGTPTLSPGSCDPIPHFKTRCAVNSGRSRGILHSDWSETRTFIGTLRTRSLKIVLPANQKWLFDQPSEGRNCGGHGGADI
jgi:hypothetical protein